MNIYLVKKEPCNSEKKKSNSKDLEAKALRIARNQRSLDRYRANIIAEKKKAEDLMGMSFLEELRKTGKAVKDLALLGSIFGGNDEALTQGFLDYFNENAHRMSPQSLRRYKQFIILVRRKIEEADAKFIREERERERHAYIDDVTLDFVLENFESIKIIDGEAICSDPEIMEDFFWEADIDFRDSNYVNGIIIELYNMLEEDAKAAEFDGNKKIGEKKKS